MYVEAAVGSAAAPLEALEARLRRWEEEEEGEEAEEERAPLLSPTLFFAFFVAMASDGGLGAQWSERSL